MAGRIIAATVVVLLVAVAMAAEQCPSNAPEAGTCSAQSDQTSPAQQPDDLAATVMQEARRKRLELFQEWGFTLQDLLVIRTYKARMHRIRDQLEDALQQLAVVMYTENEDPQVRKQTAEQIAERCRKLQEEDRKLQEELMERVGAKDDPLKLAGLMLMGCVDSGRRVLCEISPGVAGGAQGTGLPLARGHELRQSLGGPPQRPRRPRAWWHRRRPAFSQPSQPQQAPTQQPPAQ